jgi:hypothetical protein
MICGDVGVLSVTVMVAESGPVACGTKRAPMRHSAPGARVALQVFEVTNEEAFVPPSVMLPK